MPASRRHRPRQQQSHRRATGKLIRYTRTIANNQALLLPDCDEEGEAGFKDLLWKHCEAKVEIRLAWSSQTHPNRQPETLTLEEWQEFSSNLPN